MRCLQAYLSAPSLRSTLSVSSQHLAEAIAAGRSEALPRPFWLKQRRLIRPLFDRSDPDARSVAVGCVRLVFRAVPREEVGPGVPVQVGFAPGRRTRSAVGRNRLRRQMREVYRRHQRALVDLFLRRGDTLTLMVLFRGDPDRAPSCLSHDLPAALERVLQNDVPPTGAVVRDRQ